MYTLHWYHHAHGQHRPTFERPGAQMHDTIKQTNESSEQALTANALSCISSTASRLGQRLLRRPAHEYEQHWYCTPRIVYPYLPIAPQVLNPDCNTSMAHGLHCYSQSRSDRLDLHLHRNYRYCLFNPKCIQFIPQVIYTSTQCPGHTLDVETLGAFKQRCQTAIHDDMESCR